MSFGLHAEPQSEAQGTHRVGGDVSQGNKPRIFLHEVQIVARQVQFDVIVLPVAATDDSNSLETAQGLLQGVIKRGAGFLTDELSKAPTVYCEYSGVNVAIQNMPSNAKDGLISNQANRVRFMVFGRMGEFEFEHSGDDTPSVRVDVIGRSRQHTTGMNHLMALFAHRDPFKHVIVVICDNMVEGFFGITIEFPEVQNDMIEFDNMMAFQVFSSATSQTCRTNVSADPICV